MSRILTIARIVWLEALRRKDAYVLLILLTVLLFVLMSIDIFGISAALRYLVDLGLVLAWLFSLVLAISLTGRQLPTEESRGTVFSLLAKPVSRGEFLTGKWLGTWTAVSLATLAFYGVFVGVVYLRGGSVDGWTTVQTWGLHAMALSVVVAGTLALSTRLNADAAITLAFVTLGSALIVVPRIPSLVAQETGLRANLMMVLYFLLPHFELFDMRRRMVHGWGTIPWTTFAWVTVYAVVLTLGFLLVAWLSYRTKRFVRGGTL
jgi:ABC-type transport system involved in multi-copper enzyme maturation permease subunit